MLLCTVGKDVRVVVVVGVSIGPMELQLYGQSVPHPPVGLFTFCEIIDLPVLHLWVGSGNPRK